VVKPAISATAFMTFQTSPAQAEADQNKLDAILKNSGALVQEFMPEIIMHGEWSLVFFAGEYSHAVVKQPQAGDFRVQTDFGGSYRAAIAPPEFIAQAQALLRLVDQHLLYARVDGIEREGQFILMELELIEPSLFLRADAAAPARFAQAIEKFLRI
jgi:glutathione synthase/RimK-type ligase-like ATP-grasp enzyme